MIKVILTVIYRIQYIW